MNKAELINAMAFEAGIERWEAERALKAVTSIVSDQLSKGRPVQIRGFGSFTVYKRKEKVGRDIGRKQEVFIPSANVVKFKAGKELIGEVNALH